MPECEGNRARWETVSHGPEWPPEPVFGPKEIAEEYRNILVQLDGDECEARLCLDAFLAGWGGFMPAKRAGADDPFMFEDWALGLIGALPFARTKKKGTDPGIDGIRYFMDEQKGGAWISKRMLVQVKGGHVKSGDIRDCVGTLSREGAEMGVFLTLEEPTKPMIAEAASAGMYTSPWDREVYPKVQVLTVGESLADPSKPNPRCLQVSGGGSQHTLPVAPRHYDGPGAQGKLQLE